MQNKKPKKPAIQCHGPVCEHDQVCHVMHQERESAVLDMQTGVFHPSWKAQEKGWHLVNANSKFKKFLLKYFFNVK